MWKTIKKGVKEFFEILNILSPLLYFIIIIWYLFKGGTTVNDFMWFMFFLVVYGTSEIVDAIKESKEK